MLARRLAFATGRAGNIVSLPAALQQQGATYAASAASSGGETPGGDPTRQAFSYCVNQVKTHDYENYLWITQLPKKLRAPIFALRAFNVETALISGHAKSEMLVLMRCQVPFERMLVQWWRDAVNDCYKGKPAQQPIITALAEVLQAGVPLTRYRLQQIVSTREGDLLSHAQPASLAALEQYADGTAGQLLQLHLEAAGISSSSSSGGSDDSSSAAAAAEHAAAHLGKAAGVAALLRGTHVHAASQQRVYLPADLCRQHGISEEDVLAGRDSDGLRDVTLAVASAAKQHLEEARRLLEEVPADARSLFAPAVATGMYLDALEKAQFNLFDQRMLKGGFSPLAYQLQLKWALLRNKY